jgi:hypothetical protein
MTNKKQFDARVKIVAGAASGAYGHVVEATSDGAKAEIKLDDGRTLRGVPSKAYELVEMPRSEQDFEKLIARIKKIHTQAESAKAIGSEAEAATFAASVQKMLMRYRIDMSDLEARQHAKDEPIEDELINWGAHGFESGRQKQWIEDLASVVARAHFCRILISKSGDAIWLVGRSTDRRVAEYVIVTLRRTAEELADREGRAYRRQQRREVGATLGHAKNFAQGWYRGFIQRVAERYREERDASVKASANAGTALVRVQKIDEEVGEYVSAKYKKTITRKVTVRDSNNAGRQAGRLAGSRANLRANGLEEGPGGASTKRLPG